jgi:hypothetical protein
MNLLRSSALVVLVTLVLLPTHAKADQIVVTPGSALEIRFTVPHPVKTFTDLGPLAHGLFYPDMIYFDLSNVTIHDGIGMHSAFLYDGDALLGVVTDDLRGDSFIEMGSFMSASSLFYGGPDRQTVIDMTSILDGTIDGRLVFTISRGALVLDDATHITAQLGLGYDGTFGEGDFVNIVSVDTVHPVPEPASLILVGSGLAGVAARRWKRKA